MQDLFDTPPPPPDKRPFLRLAKVTPGHKYQFLILSDRLYTVSTHFRDGETSICIGEDQGCALCADGFPSRWSAFLAVCGIRDERPLLLAITAGAYHNCPPLMACKTGFRGRIIACERMGSRSNSPLKVEIHKNAQAEAAVARLTNPDVPAALSRLWKLNISSSRRIEGTHDDSAHKTEEVLARESEAQDEPIPAELLRGSILQDICSKE